MLPRLLSCTTLIALLLCVNHVTCDVISKEEKEINTVRDVLRTVEKRVVEQIHKKYASEKRENSWGKLKKTLEDYIESEKKSLDFPRVPHREINDSPGRIPHREIDDAPRIPHREIDDAPRVPHRELDAFPRVPHREISLPRVPHKDAPRIPHRELNDLPRVPHRDALVAFPRAPHRDSLASLFPRVPHKDSISTKKSTLSKDFETKILREIFADHEGELQDRSEGCLSTCIGVFDQCLHTITKKRSQLSGFKECASIKRRCIQKNPVCL